MQSAQQKTFYYKHGWRTLFTVDTVLICLLLPMAFYGFSMFFHTVYTNYSLYATYVYTVLALFMSIKRVFNDPVPFVCITSQLLIINYANFGYIFSSDKIPLDQINKVEVWQATYRGAKSVYLKITAAKKVYKVYEELLQTASDFEEIERSIRAAM